MCHLLFFLLQTMHTFEVQDHTSAFLMFCKTIVEDGKLEAANVFYFG